MTKGIESEIIAHTFGVGFYEQAAIRKPLRVITDCLAYGEAGNKLRKRQLENTEPFYDFASTASAALIHSFSGALICENLFSEYQEMFKKNQISLAPLMWARHLLEGGIILNLQNCCTFMSGKNAAAILNETQRDSIKKSFAEFFPRLTDARDALVHEHDRSTGRVRSKKISDLGQMTNSIPTGIAGLIDQNGVKFEFDFSSKKIVALACKIAEIVSEPAKK